MKIALLTQGYRTNMAEAANITIRLLAEELARQKHDVVIFCSQIEQQPLIEHFKGFTVKRKRCSRFAIVNMFKILSFSKSIKKDVQQSKREFDVIHNFSASPLLAIRGLLAKQFSRKATLIQTIKAKTELCGSYFFTPLLNFYDVVTVPTKFLKKRLILSGLRTSKICMLQSYINIQKFKPQDKNKLKEKHGFADKKLLVYYGHLSEKKGISFLIHALRKLKETADLDFLTLLVTGSSQPFIAPYETLIHKNKLEKNIKIIKTTKHIEEYVNMAEVVVLPYSNLKSTEAQPSCILETMASKTLLITTNLSELRELVSPKEVIFAKPANAVDLANKLRNALKKKPDRAMLNRAYKKATQFDHKKVLQKYITLYGKCSAQKKKGKTYKP